MFDRVRKKFRKQIPERETTDRIPWSARSWQGSVIRAIVSSGHPLTWKEIQEATGLEEKQLNRALTDLRSSGEVLKIEDRWEKYAKYQVSEEFYPTYSEIYNLKIGLTKWINQWKEGRKLDFSLEHEQFFLEGRHLDDFSKELISHAKSEVLLVNPFIQDCDLSNTLREAKKNGTKVQIITRIPQDKFLDKLKKKQEYHSTLKQEGISLVYKEKVHAKLVVVDRVAVIVSSMNFYADSSAGVSWEAGLVSIDTKVVESIIGSLSKLV